MQGTCRTFSRELHAELPEKVRRVAENTAAAYGCSAELNYEVFTEPLFCDPDTTALGLKSAEKTVGSGNAIQCDPTMIAEDFCYYAEIASSVFFNLGTLAKDAAEVYPLHSDHVIFDESSIEIGAAVLAQTAIDLLDSLNA